MIEYLNNLDTSIFLAINGAHSPFFDSFMTLFTGRFIWIPMYAVVLWIMFRECRWQTASVYLVSLVAAIFLTDQTCASVIRPAVERMRPSNLENTLSELAYVVDGYRGGSYGFPSCHAANSFAFAVFLALFVRRRGFVLFIIGWAVVNSYSRLYLGVHYPGDLIVGAVVGSLFGMACYYAAGAVSSRLLHDSYPHTKAGGGSRIDGDAAVPVTLRQLTPGAPLESLTPSAALHREISAAPVCRIVASDMMIATFAVILAVIIVISALH